MRLTVLNESGALDAELPKIKTAYEKAAAVAKETLNLTKADIIFRSQPNLAIPELGVGGYTETDGHTVYISIDPTKKINEQEYYGQLLHELHHCARFQALGYEDMLAYALGSEGSACLFENEMTGRKPIYAEVKLDDGDIAKANKAMNSTEKYDHPRWFFGSKDIPRWFGYSYGYQLCAKYAADNKISSARMATVPAQKILGL